MHIVVTGADGFVGAALVSRLQRNGGRDGSKISKLTPVDRFDCDISVRASVDALFDDHVDCVFHLASVPGGTAEQHYELSRDVNVQGTTNLLEASRAQVLRGDRPPVFVFASTIGVFASRLPHHVDDDTRVSPGMTYGAQKLLGEVLVAEFSRRGWVDGRSPRLPTVLSRPPARTGQLSAFMSDMIRELVAGHSIICPANPSATTWASSIGNVIDNLLHAANVDSAALSRRTFLLPTLHFSFAELVQAIGEVRGEAVSHLVTWSPDATIEQLFGSFPRVSTNVADAAGFTRDCDLPTLVRRSLEMG
jgi:D-erythronate 2-dehydrogenase